MKKKKAFALIMALAMGVSLVGCGGSGTGAGQADEAPAQNETQEQTPAEDAAKAEDAAADAGQETDAADTEAAGESEEAVDYGGITLSFMNSKPELQDALEEITSEWGTAHNVEFVVYKTDAPADTLAQKYAAGDAPTLAIVDPGNITEMGEEKFLALADEKWVADGGDALGTKVNGVLYGFPLCVEAPGMIYNKTAIEEILGKDFVAADYATPDTFKALLEELRAGGMEDPVILNSETWSLGGHLFGNLYQYQPGGDAESAYAFVKDLKSGTPVSENAAFKDLITDFEMFIEYNINKQDPLAADYDLNASYLAEGEAAFWINGTWVWPDMEPYVDGSMDYGVMPIPITDSELSGNLWSFASKCIVIDKETATEDQQAAAKDFLHWLVYTEEGQDALVNKCAIVVAFTNNPLPPTNPVNVSLKTYIDAGNTHENSPFTTPTDHTNVIAPHMQAYMAGQETAEDLAKTVEEYWQTHDPS